MGNEDFSEMKGTRRFAVTIIATLGLVAIVGSGGGGGGPAATETINGVVVPPDPGPAADATIAGVDADANGIRDDVDRFIAINYGNSAAHLATARVSAKALQAVLLADSASMEASTRALYASMDAGVCVAKTLLAAGVAPTPVLNALFAKTNNTLERINQRTAVTMRAGPIARSATALVCP